MMPYDPHVHHRRSIRLQGYDYARSGAYFVTICTRNRECLFGEIIDGQMVLNDAGGIVQAAWDDLPNHYADVELDECVVMPNHVHGIVVIVGAGLKPAPTTPPAPTTGTIKRHGLPEIIRAWETFSARRIHRIRKTPGAKLWQRNYWERVIRNESEYNRIREYIRNNTSQWKLDKLNPARDHWLSGDTQCGK